MVPPPTVETWTSLFHLYLFFGSAAAVIVISFFVYNLAKRSGGTEPERRENARRAKYRTIALLLVSISVLSTVEIATFRSTSLITGPSDPVDPLTVKVIGRQFFWTFVYPNNLSTVGTLFVPVGREVILNITSDDVFHSFAIQQLDVAKDAIPGRWNTLWFEVPTPMNYTVACKELCGVGHYAMTGTLYAVNAATFDACYSQLNATTTCYLPPQPSANSTVTATSSSAPSPSSTATNSTGS